MKYWIAIYKILYITVIIILLLAALFLFTPKLNELHKMQQTRNRKKEENLQLLAKINDLKLKQEKFKTDAEFVEQIAKQMNYVKTNEVIYKFTPNPKDPAGDF